MTLSPSLCIRPISIIRRRASQQQPAAASSIISRSARRQVSKYLSCLAFSRKTPFVCNCKPSLAPSHHHHPDTPSHPPSSTAPIAPWTALRHSACQQLRHSLDFHTAPPLFVEPNSRCTFDACLPDWTIPAQNISTPSCTRALAKLLYRTRSTLLEPLPSPGPSLPNQPSRQLSVSYRAYKQLSAGLGSNTTSTLDCIPNSTRPEHVDQFALRHSATVATTTLLSYPAIVLSESYTHEPHPLETLLCLLHGAHRPRQRPATLAFPPNK